MKRLVKKEDLVRLIGSLLAGFEIIAPKEVPNKGIFYQVLENGQDLSLGKGFAIEPIKRFFLEPSSWILRHGKNSGSEVESYPLPDKKRIIIGARPCETRGLVLLDKIFDSEYKDDFYINNRKRTIIVGLLCSTPDKTCFCTSMNASPVESKGMDAYLLQLGRDLFVLETISERSKGLFRDAGRDLTKEDEVLLDEAKKNCIDKIKKKIKVSEGLGKIFEDDYWNEVSSSCINCGVCTFLCPTCHCFDLVDEERKRLRSYDGCSFPDFTLESSGVNPRPTKRERYRQRVYHKFDYFKRNFGENLCVGCGRCIRHCPVKIDIADIVDKAPVK
ncbi:MAG: 4Fe-4S dicluster domain-containing protein [Candidatus Omnitrophota bacterium]